MLPPFEKAVSSINEVSVKFSLFSFELRVCYYFKHSSSHIIRESESILNPSTSLLDWSREINRENNLHK
jgi:hypothetical protein